MEKSRSSGILVHISSLPSPFGIGVLGNECKNFIDKISESGFKLWQILPINITDDANSPYCSVSSMAGNYVFIDPRSLEGINEEDIKSNFYDGSPYTADYDFANKSRLNLLKKSYDNLSDESKIKLNEFIDKTEWLPDFALFMAIKTKYNNLPWWKWDKKYSIYNNCIKHKNEFTQEMMFWCYTQYVFYKQYNEIKTYANNKNIDILGDMPIYVAMDSVDVWSNIAEFEIEQDTLKPKKLAGVPPDYFSKDGQLWGNPLYNWPEMKKNKYSWWKRRLKHSLQIFDSVRIDHFRGFASYWAVPSESKTAKIGEWLEGPKMDLFNEINKEFKNPNIIAEDLGVFGNDVIKLLNDTNFPGMRVIQFGFEPDGDSSHLPHNYVSNTIAYVGTHDNNTILGWLWDATPEQREFALDYCGFQGDNWGEGGYTSMSCRKIIEAVWRSVSKTAIISVQDMCGFGCDARMNIPGIPEKNWRYRTTQQVIDSIDWKYFEKINRLYKR